MSVDIARRRWPLPAVLLAVALGGCGRSPQPSLPAPLPPPPEPVVPAGHDLLGLVAYAASLSGTPYRSGGTSPRTGFDCSGLVQHVYGRLGIALPRSTREMAGRLSAVAPERREPGDLIFFNTTGAAHSHVGIYLGDDEFVHAPSSGGSGVTISNLRQDYWRRRLDGVRRPPLP
jgi:cell wall-associated NlpC family hydrolase